MAIVDDIRKDVRTKNVLAQTNTKTVSAPPSSTGLTGDQLPAEVFTVDDFDLVRNQVHLEEKNFQLLEALNTMGQITNMQSQSGPIPGTYKNVVVTDTTGSGSPVSTLFQPDNGQVWMLIAAQTSSTFNADAAALNLTDSTTSVKIARETAANTDFEPIASPIYITYENRLTVTYSNATGNCTSRAAVIRVR
jgi:hypothetical protein